ncbi:MAG: ABC transporter ATP-binding protein [Candidatus Schekmanbacteria bacterium]|nr:ABC transporter ATP-binding protein [Candidatus Schekmanbacteria bacterium]
MLDICGLNLRLDDFNLRDINLKVRAGEYYIILGPTGSGKTVLLEALAGLRPIDSGQILFSGQDVTGLPPEERNIGMVYQDYALFPHLTVKENIAYGLKKRKMGESQWIEAQIGRLGEFLNIDHLMKRYPINLSGGEKQRVALARALAIKPQLLLLDEPLSALDRQSKRRIQGELRRIHKELEQTILHITHDMEEALSLGDKVAVMEGGKIVQAGTLTEVFQKPVNPFVAGFVGHDNIFNARVGKRNGEKVVLVDKISGVAAAPELEFSVSAIDVPAGSNGFLLIPAEGIILSTSPIQSSARNLFFATVISLEKVGIITHVTLDMGIPIVATITSNSAQDMKIQSGCCLYAACKATSLHFFSPPPTPRSL